MSNQIKGFVSGGGLAKNAGIINLEDERELFETTQPHLCRFPFRFDDSGFYLDEGVQLLWQTWQAACSLPMRVPEGYKLVPVEPTMDMMHAWRVNAEYGAPFRQKYQAMLAAAPQPPENGK